MSLCYPRASSHGRQIVNDPLLNSKLNCTLVRPRGHSSTPWPFLRQVHSLVQSEYRVRSSASSLNVRYHLFYLRSSSSCLCLLIPLPVTSIIPYIQGDSPAGGHKLLSIKQFGTSSGRIAPYFLQLRLLEGSSYVTYDRFS